jgi:hypothetical protein
MSDQPPEPEKLFGVTLEKYATISSGLCDKFPLEALLELEDVDPSAWHDAEDAWQERLMEDVDQDGTLSLEFDYYFLQAQDRFRRPVPPLDEHLQSWLDYFRHWSAHPNQLALLRQHELKVSDITRLHRFWSGKMSEDPRLQQQAQQILSAEPGPMPHPRPEPHQLPKIKKSQPAVVEAQSVSSSSMPSGFPGTSAPPASGNFHQFPSIPPTSGIPVEAQAFAMDSSHDPSPATPGGFSVGDSQHPSQAPAGPEADWALSTSGQQFWTEHASGFVESPTFRDVGWQPPATGISRFPSSNEVRSVVPGKEMLAASNVPEAPPPPSTEPNHQVELTMAQYASLCAELSVFPAASEKTFVSYGLMSAQDRTRVDAYWKQRLASSPEEYRQWQGFYQRFHIYWTAEIQRGYQRLSHIHHGR